MSTHNGCSSRALKNEPEKWPPLWKPHFVGNSGPGSAGFRPLCPDNSRWGGVKEKRAPGANGCWAASSALGMNAASLSRIVFFVRASGQSNILMLWTQTVFPGKTYHTLSAHSRRVRDTFVPRVTLLYNVDMLEKCTEGV